MAIVYSLYALGRLSSSLYLIYPCVFIYQKMTGAFAKPIAYGLTIEIEILAFLEDLFEVKTLGINSLKLEVDLTNFFFCKHLRGREGHGISKSGISFG